MAGSIYVHGSIFVQTAACITYCCMLACYAGGWRFREMREKLQQRRDDDLRPSESSCVGCISIDLLGGCSVSCLLINSVKAAFTAQCVEELS